MPLKQQKSLCLTPWCAKDQMCQAASINYPTENQPTFNTCSVAWMGLGVLIQVGHILHTVQMINTAARLVRSSPHLLLHLPTDLIQLTHPRTYIMGWRYRGMDWVEDRWGCTDCWDRRQWPNFLLSASPATVERDTRRRLWMNLAERSVNRLSHVCDDSYFDDHWAPSCRD